MYFSFLSLCIPLWLNAIVIGASVMGAILERKVTGSASTGHPGGLVRMLHGRAIIHQQPQIYIPGYNAICFNSIFKPEFPP
jgi:hypothetical protein